MFDFMGMVGVVMAALSAEERAAAATYTYAQVEADLAELGDAVNVALAKDDAEAQAFWTKLSAVMPLTVLQIAAKALFQAQSAQAKAAVMADLSVLRVTCASLIGIHANVPDQLDEDVKTWTLNRTAVKKRIPRCKDLKSVSGWGGKDKINYDLAVDVQVEALQELEGIMASTAQGCQAGALLNRAVFFVVGKAARQATRTIGNAPGSTGVSFYRRTGAAQNALGVLGAEIQAAQSGDVAAGSANVLSSEIRKTITLPNLLQVGSWPSGTDKAGTTSADTEQGVTSKGDDADLAIPDAG